MKPSDFLKNNKNLTREEMQQYLEGNLSVSDKRNAEEKLIDDEFSSEAADGYAESKLTFAAIPSFQAAGVAADKSMATEKGNISGAKNGFNYKFWFIGTLTLAVISLTIIGVMLMNDESPTNQTASVPVNDENVIAENTTPLEISEVMTDQELKDEIIEIKKAEQIAPAKQITYEKTIAEQPKTVEVKEPEIVLEPIAVVDPKVPEEITIDHEPKVSESNVKLLYIKNLKAVDYSEFYTSSVAKKEWLLTGVSADKENASSEGMEIQQTIKYIPYKEFLIEYLTKFSKNDFKGALSGLLIIQQQFPDDLNAAFYSGLCYYNLGKNRQAIAAFDKALLNSFTTFREEAEWYKALSLLEYGKKSEAKELMKKIEKEGGFYAKRAKEKLSKMR